ncbi:Co-chaperone Hsc20 [Suillus weaverae]|nr:Co-chaperone Hsc20 [Suillus weaverae]
MFRPFLVRVVVAAAQATHRPLALSNGYYTRAFTDKASSSSSRYSVITSLTKTCPSCGTILPTALPVCPNCNYIARIHDSISYHDILGLPYEPNPFVVDAALLKRRFIEAQRVSHPDAWATKSEFQRDVALHVSNTLNAAYKALSSPLHRIEYILQRNGLMTAEADPLEDPELISEIMEVREEIEAGNIERIRTLEEDNDNKIREVVSAVTKSVAEKNWEETKVAAVRLKYLNGIADAIKQRLDNM